MTQFSVVIPTHQRREVVVSNVAKLGTQTQSDFEVVVVDDGSRDGTAQALRALDVPFSLTVIEQPNRGVAAARNVGAAAAAGEYLLFLDDDMEADQRLLAEHARSHAAGADVVLGDLPIHPEAPRNVLSWGVGLWASTRRERLMNGPEIPTDEVLTGQLSISRDNYERLHAFDVGFTRRGLAPGADLDFGQRARSLGLRLVFNPDAISYQYYDVDPGEYLKRAREDGRSSYELALKHPDQPDRFRMPGFQRRRDRWLLEPFAVAPSALSWPLRAGVAWLVRCGHTGPRLRNLFFAVRTMERQRGVRMARRASSTGEAVVLAYHAIADAGKDPILRRYSVPPARFAKQLDSLISAGWTFIDASMLLAALAGERQLPHRAALITFDDAYGDFVEAALPELRSRGISAVVFAVAGQPGGTNIWDQEIGGRTMALMTAEALVGISQEGIEIGSHALTHWSMAKLEPAELERETCDSAAVLESLGLPRPRLFAYPYGIQTPEAVAAVVRAGYAAAFTITPGLVARDSPLYALPRIQVLRGYRPTILRLRIALARRRSEHLERWFDIVGTRG